MKEINLSLEELSEKAGEYASIIGIDNFIALSKMVGGANIYIPKYEEIKRASNYKNVIEDYKSGMPVRAIAKKYSVCERTVYNYMKKEREKKQRDKKKENKKENLIRTERQMNIYDFLK